MKYFTGSDIQGSLFNPNGATNSDSRLSFREFLSLLKPPIGEPNIQGPLFGNGGSSRSVDDRGLVQLSPELLERLAQRPKGVEPNFIPSLFADFAELGEDLKRNARRKRVIAMISVSAHLLAIGFVIYFVGIQRATSLPAAKPVEVTMLLPNPPALILKVPGNNKPGGGGGGGGRQEVTPASLGRLPKTSSIQLVPPDPRPIETRNDALIADPTIIIPIEIPQNIALPIGDPSSLAAPPSSGSGRGGGVGSGSGTGAGSGRGPGYGPGSGGGMGGGKGGGIGTGEGTGIASSITAGVRYPEVLAKPLPPYTEPARRNKIMGIVVLHVIIRKDGSVDNPRIVRGLGYGLDESALQTVLTGWRFRPAVLNGKPVDFETNIEVGFNLL
ncbi:MAG: energy transducer TonB [Acidobacteria bacterium]|nr:energy transducer TonB [Acidobacteriota bacterium]MBI3655463.1 energy transducer TonB [Acidobacteriota bacterium]